MNEFEQMELKRKQCANLTIFGIVGIIGGALLTYLLQASTPVIGIIIIVVGFIVIIVGSVKFSALKKHFKNTFLRDLISKTFNDAEYYPKKGIDKKIIYDTNLVKKADRFSSEDLIKGSIEGVDFSTCDLKLEERHTRHTKNGTQTYYVTYFLGRFFEFEFPKEFKSKIIVTEGIVSTWFSKFKKIELESIDFNKKFKTYTLNEHDAFYVLTPHLMEAILELERTNPGTLALGFTGKKLFIAINNNRNTFELSLFSKIDTSTIDQLVRDLNVIKGIVLELKLNRNIFAN